MDATNNSDNMPQAQPEILLLSESEAASAVDRRALRDAGLGNAHVMTSGIEAARYLAALDWSRGAQGALVVVCAKKLEDMDGEQFCAIIRQHPLLLALPVLLLVPNDGEAEELEALGCGASAVLGRPYSVDTMRERIRRLAQETKGHLPPVDSKPDTAAFEAALASYGLLLRPERQPDDYFRAGMKCLGEKKWNAAISAFQYALQNPETEAEAQLGLAAAFRGKGEMAKVREWLARGAESLVRAKRWKLARTSFARLLQHEPEAKNPFLAEARRLIRQKEYEDAAEVLAQGISVIPKSKTGSQYASVCLGAEDPNAMLRALAGSLGREDENYEYLSAEIRQSLEIMTRERNERQKAMAAERKWQLSRQMAEKKAQPSPAAGEASQGATEKLAVEAAAPLAADVDSFEPEDALPGEDDAVAGSAPVLAPLTRHEATSGLFDKKPKLNEFLSVVKLTWKLARRTGKKEKAGKT